ncbi:His-Xaa-Ser system-associated MauG-like protein [Nitrincola sp.]|uniref:His-Xaa-Ser system-associated MauG-like protein n=1 Tax=Nitrincola sp. TaxID=1926584 RepID=UPI003A91E4B8
MKFVTRALSICSAIVLPFTTSAKADSFTEILRNAILDNGFLPAHQLNIPVDAAQAAVGKQLFESTDLSLNGKMACRTCHLDEFGSADGLPNAVGVFGEGEGPERASSEGKIVPRNTLPLWGRGARGFDVFFWDGKVDFSQDNQISQFGSEVPSEDPLVIAAHLPPVEIREMIVEDQHIELLKTESVADANNLYAKVIENLNAKEPNIMSNLAKANEVQIKDLDFFNVAFALASFIRSEFELKNTPLHEFVFGQLELTDEEVAGGLLFYGKGKCANCHNGPHFSDLQFHAIPFPQTGFGKNGFGIDYGRFNVTFDPSDLYRFRTPPLWNVELTAPYGHSGSMRTIEDAIEAHYDPLKFVDTQKMTSLERREHFKRLAAVADEFRYIGALESDEVEKVSAFLKLLTFQ